MPRIARVSPGGMLFHVLNRGVGRMRIFRAEKDYEAFHRVVEQTLQVAPIRICVYCWLPNHWHFVLWPEHDGDLSRFMQRMANMHTQRWQRAKLRIGYGHLYQGRFKSFPIESDEHFYSVVRFILSSMRRPDPIKTPLLFCRHPGPRALTVAPSVRLSAGLLEGSGGSAVSRQVVGDNRQTTEENLLIPEFFSSTFAPLHTPSLMCRCRNRRGGDGEPAFPSWCPGRKGTWGKRSSYETTM